MLHLCCPHSGTDVPARGRDLCAGYPPAVAVHIVFAHVAQSLTVVRLLLEVTCDLAYAAFPQQLAVITLIQMLAIHAAHLGDDRTSSNSHTASSFLRTAFHLQTLGS